MVQEKYDVLTLPSDLYRRDYVECPWAKERAKQRVTDIVNNGKLDRNYKRLISALTESNLPISNFIYRLVRKRVLV